MTKSDNIERENRILDTAIDLIIHYGYDKTTVADIAKEAGISKGAVYLHFTSKDELFEALLIREIQQYSQTWLDLIDADPQGGTIASLYKNTLYALNRSPFMSALFKQDRRVMGSYLRKPDNFYQRNQLSGMRHEFLKMMQDAGAIRKEVDPLVVAHIMNMLAYGLVTIDEYIPSEQIPPLDQVIETIGEMLNRLLEPEDGGNQATAKAIIHQVVVSARQQLTENQAQKKDTI